MSLVLDTSAVLAWAYNEQAGVGLEELMGRVAEEGAWVPCLWPLEVANVLEMGCRRGRHSEGFRDEVLSSLAELEIRVDPETNEHAWGATALLAREHRLTLYDAAYLELALRRGLALATLDKELRAAALAERVPVLGE